MLQLLIVDDEILFVEGIKTEIPWEKLGISSVFTAYNIRQAKEIFRERRIDILLCDIEMPRGSGLELLAWVREHYPETESVFLTCHADFQYAQQAIQLGSFDYLLKPVPNGQLEKVIAKAGEKIGRKSELESFSRYGQFWVQHQPMLVERFWLDIVHQTVPSNSAAIRQAAAERGIPFSDEMRFLPVLIGVQRYHKPLNTRDEKLLDYALQKSADEMIVQRSERGQTVSLGSRRLLTILLWNHDADAEFERLKQQCEAYILSCIQFFYCDISCYIGRRTLVHELPAMVQELSLLEKNNVAHNNKAFVLTGAKPPSRSVPMPDMDVWSAMLKKGYAGNVVAEAAQYLHALAETDGLNAGKLHQFHHDFLQLIYHVLKLKGIQAHQLLSDPASIELSASATRSVTDTIAWLRHITERSLQYVRSVEQTESVVERVKRHIALGLNEQGLTREDIASRLFLNPDYLDRLFKKGTGLSVTEYLLQERIGIAKELLAKTDMPVGAVASHIGYSNLAHFSRRFKLMTNMTPNEYRQHAGRNQTSEKSKLE